MGKCLPKINVLPFAFVSDNIYFLECLDYGVNMDVDGERAGVHHNFALIYYFLGVNGIRGRTFAPPHLPHIFGTLGVNLTHLLHLAPHFLLLISEVAALV
jgi:hypothetical protein